MPVTINEVEVNTTVTENSGSNNSSGKEGGKDGKTSPEDIDKIIEACMLKVKELLDEHKER